MIVAFTTRDLRPNAIIIGYANSVGPVGVVCLGIHAKLDTFF